MGHYQDGQCYREIDLRKSNPPCKAVARRVGRKNRSQKTQNPIHLLRGWRGHLGSQDKSPTQIRYNQHSEVRTKNHCKLKIH